MKPFQLLFRLRARLLFGLFLFSSLHSLKEPLSANPVSSTQCVVNTSSRSLVFTWTHQPGNSYTVALATAPNNGAFKAAISSYTTAANLNSATFTAAGLPFLNLLPNTSYFFRVKISTDADDSAAEPIPSYGGQISTYTLPNLPSSSATAVGVSTVTLNLGLHGNTSGQYHLQLSTSPLDATLNFSDPGARVVSATGTLPSGATDFGTLLSGATYFLRARTLWVGASPAGIEHNASGYMTLSTTTLPVLPTLSLSGVGVGSFTVIVGTGNNNDNFLYEISYSTTSNFFSGVSTGLAASGSLLGQTTTFTGLASNVTYYIRARSLWNGAGINLLQNASGYTSVISTTVLPVLPTSSITAVGLNSISLIIGQADNAGGNYHIQLATDSSFGGSGLQVHSATGTLPGGTTAFGGLLSGATYFTRVRTLWNGQSQGLEQNASGFISLTTGTLPALPTFSLTGVGIGSFTVIVGTGNNNGNFLYEISYSTSGNFAAPVSTALSPSGTLLGRTTTFTGLTPDSTYYIRARALWNSAGSNLLSNASGYVAVSTFVPQTAQPLAPSGLTATANSISAVTFSWTDNSTNEDGFRLLDNAGGLLATVGANATSHPVTGLNIDQAVTSLGVAAFNDGGTSTHSAAVTVYALANPPASPTFDYVKKTEIKISWSNNANPNTVIYEVSQSPDNFVSAPSTPIAFGFEHALTSATLTGGLSAGGTYYFRIRARNRGGAATAFSSIISTVTPPLTDVILSTGGVINAGETTVTASSGVTISNTVLPGGQTQQSFISTKTATVTYGNGASFEVPPGVNVTVIATGDSIQLTSTQTIPIASAGFIVEPTSGTVTIQTSGTAFTISLSSSAPQNVSATIPTATSKTVEIFLNPPSGQIKTSIPPGALSENVKMRVKLPDTFPSVSAALKFSPTLFGSPAILKGLAIGLEIELDKNIQPGKPVPITMTYRDADLSGAPPDTLIVARHDESIQKWVTLPTSVNSSGRTVTGTSMHFSKFQVMSLTPAGDVTQPKVFPNPLEIYRGQTEMTFTNLSANASLKIYTYLGELVRELKIDATGTVHWNGKNSYGDSVASGIYFALLEGAQDSRKVMRIAVEK